MPISETDLAALDFASNGEPFYQAAASTALDLGTLDYPSNGEPFYALTPVPSGPHDTSLAAEFGINLSFTGSLSTQIALASEFTIELSFDQPFINLGNSAKMEIIF